MTLFPIRPHRNQREAIAAFGLAFAFWAYIALSSGLFHGGFLLWDDIVVADLHDRLKSAGFMDVYAQFAEEDLRIRFRPLVLLHYLAMAKIYGLNYPALLWHNIVIASLACTFLFLAARNSGATTIASALFVAVTCLGNQAVFAMRISLGETPGMLMIGVSAFALTKGRRMLAVVFFLLAALTKESFVLLAPALLWADMLILGEKRIGTYAYTHRSFVVGMSVSALAVLAVIILHVGTHAIGYAGVDRETLSLTKLAGSFTAALFLKGYALALIPVAYGIYIKAKRSETINLNILWRGVILCALVLLPQATLYAKSGIFMHYLLPALLWSGLAILMLWNDPLGMPLRLHGYFRTMTKILLLFNIILLANNARDIARWGHDARIMLERVTTLTGPGDTIVIIGHPVRDYEKAADAAKFLASDLYGRARTSILPTTGADGSGTPHEQLLTRRFLDANHTDMERRSILLSHAACILFMPGALDDLQKNDPAVIAIAGMDTTRVANYLIATPSFGTHPYLHGSPGKRPTSMNGDP